MAPFTNFYIYSMNYQNHSDCCEKQVTMVYRYFNMPTLYIARFSARVAKILIVEFGDFPPTPNQILGQYLEISHHCIVLHV